MVIVNGLFVKREVYHCYLGICIENRFLTNKAWRSRMKIDEKDSRKLIVAINRPNMAFMECITDILHDYGDLFTDDDIFFLTDRTKSRELFKHDYPILLEIDSSAPKMRQIYLHGNYRYYANKTCVIKGKNYYYTSQLYGLSVNSRHEDNRTPLWKWVCGKLGVDPQEGVSTQQDEGDIAKMKDIVDSIYDYISQTKYYYDREMLENYYLSLKSKPFVILAGISGTGKSKLVELFAEACGATEANGRYKLVPVRPDWSDSSDLFGHMNISDKFVEGSIIDIVKRASDDPTQPYFICLDEMNLARVEYYFSDFLSIVETRKLSDDKKDIISGVLIKKDLWIRDKTAVDKFGKEDLRLPSNLYIIGTVNMDETTFPFSRKVLDRANTIEFSDVNLMPVTVEKKEIEVGNINNDFLKAEYLKLPDDEDLSEYVSSICIELEEINKILAYSNSQVAYRVRDELVSYRVLNHKYELMSEDDAMDFEIMQKILPRLQGSSIRVKKTLCDLFKHCAGDFTGSNDENASELAKSMAQTYEQRVSANNCRYKRSAKKLIDMVERYEEDGFTSFWS